MFNFPTKKSLTSNKLQVQVLVSLVLLETSRNYLLKFSLFLLPIYDGLIPIFIILVYSEFFRLIHL